MFGDTLPDQKYADTEPQPIYMIVILIRSFFIFPVSGFPPAFEQFQFIHLTKPDINFNSAVLFCF